MDTIDTLYDALKQAHRTLTYVLWSNMDLPGFDAASLIAFTAAKETDYALYGRVVRSMIPRGILKRTDEFRQDAVPVALTSRLTRRQVADDRGVGMSTLNKWITPHRYTDMVSKEDLDLSKEYGRLRREVRLLKEDREILKNGSDLQPASTDRFRRSNVRILMDGKGRFLDNIFVDRLWRSLKYECVYLHAREAGSDAKAGIRGSIRNSVYEAQPIHLKRIVY